MKQLTVAELIAELQKVADQTRLVSVMGCDCYQNAEYVEVADSDLFPPSKSGDVVIGHKD